MQGKLALLILSQCALIVMSGCNFNPAGTESSTATTTKSTMTSAVGSGSTVINCTPNESLPAVSCASEIPFATTATKSKSCNATGDGYLYGTCSLQTCQNGYIANGDQCVFSSCTANQSYGSVSCVSEIPHSVTATKPKVCSASGTDFVYGSCSVQNCEAGYHVSGNACVADPCTANQTYTAVSCASEIDGAAVATKTKTCNSTGTDYVYGSCTLQSCSSGYLKNLNTCTAVTCNPGVTYDATSCAAQMPHALLATKPTTCNSTGTGFLYGSCTIQSCETGYVLSGNVCVAQGCTPNLTYPSVSCTANITHSTAATQTRTCNSAGDDYTYGTCQLQSCEPGYMVSGNTCVAQVCTPNQTTTGASCTSQIPHATAATETKVCDSSGSSYLSSTCTLQSCESGYYANGNTCTLVPANEVPPIGNLDVIDVDQKVAGWALNKSMLTAAVTVRLYIGPTLIAEAPANLSRPDIATAFPGAGQYHGYSLQIPSSYIDGVKHTAFIKATNAAKTVEYTIGTKVFWRATNANSPVVGHSDSTKFKGIVAASAGKSVVIARDGSAWNRSALNIQDATPWVRPSGFPSNEMPVKENFTGSILTKAGNVYSDGDHGWAKLPIGTTQTFPGPVTDFVGYQNKGCVISNGQVYCFNKNNDSYYCLYWNGGVSGASCNLSNCSNYSYTYTQINLGGRIATQLTANGMVACALASGTVLCWGTDSGYDSTTVYTKGYFGSGEHYLTCTAARNSQSYASPAYGPEIIPGLESGVTALSPAETVGGNMLCAIKAGSVYCWGYGKNGFLGSGQIAGAEWKPVKVPYLPTNMTEVSGSCATNGYELYCWGLGYYDPVLKQAFNKSYILKVAGLQPGISLKNGLIVNGAHYYVSVTGVNGVATATAQLYKGFESYYPFFNPNEYISLYSDIANLIPTNGIGFAFDHFYTSGRVAGRKPGFNFDPVYYVSTNSDVKAALDAKTLTSAIDHYVQSGQYELRNPSASFSEKGYLNYNLDVWDMIQSGQYRSGLEHYLLTGKSEYRTVPKP